MPIYEYVCSSCGHQFEELAPASKRTAADCPSCGKKRAERKLSVFAAHENAPSPGAAGPPGPCGRCGDPGGSCALT